MFFAQIVEIIYLFMHILYTTSTSMTNYVELTNVQTLNRILCLKNAGIIFLICILREKWIY